ncbi:tautomerase family protein [Nocardioides sp. Kera G14]|uniref:tautomerase family protein n=1 Tax=Nocardioides sp. Kera G14 TaxID=2884264 RepID=UPI001D0FA4B1|nr:tautomerase family protein [Nocardioides sp. Kera G14]UDY23413.1 tautomerase family protein [Nocardioides sp. Kera G14]
MPHVHVTIREGRGEHAVRTLIHNLTRAVVEALDAAPETVRVVVTEVPATHWANGDVTLAEKLAAVDGSTQSPSRQSVEGNRA